MHSCMTLVGFDTSDKFKNHWSSHSSATALTYHLNGLTCPIDAHGVGRAVRAVGSEAGLEDSMLYYVMFHHVHTSLLQIFKLQLSGLSIQQKKKKTLTHR